MKDAKHTLYKGAVIVEDANVIIEENYVHFKKIRREQDGEYTITISNGIGKGCGSFSLSVISK